MVDFSGFSSESFEQFIRALGTKILGPGVTAFGDGPDGGREATFSGKVPYPFPPLTQWDGYGVFQAKFKSTSDGTAKDQAWALQQAKAELDKWVSSAKRKPKVEYFVFCTNVSLSSASGGGKDKLTKLLNLKKYGLKGHAIWDLNQLRVYIDNAADLRNRFRALFTPGDLLAAFADKLQAGDGIDVEAALTTFIAREFVTDEDARLSQAGDRSEDRIRLADVFVDLPSGPEAHSESADEDPSNLRPASLFELLKAGAHKLDPLALTEQQEAQKANPNRGSIGPTARFVFLGGPGSGKSTIGQVLAQIHRAALLHRRPPHRLEENIKTLIKSISDRCNEDGYVWPQTPRYPFRVELNYFAKALSGSADSKVNSLSEYLRKLLSKTTKIEHKHLRSLLANYPCLLILDGLDEVPASSNRKQVIGAIQEFLNEARDLECDIQIVASSRPDGYAGEFDGGEVAQRHLHPLSSARAIRCATKYVHAKIAKKDDHRAEEVITTLRTSIGNPLIAKLMHSPLQVTFMVTVVAASGKPSESRWRLFSEYYKTIYERELQKAVPPFDKALSARRSDIDALHHRVGFILQNRAEISGGTQSDMSIDEFESLVEECLSELGLENELLKHEVEMIVGAANQRLVFLTSRTPGRLSFDVRSLQEFMAAACLTSTDSSDVMPRLTQIGHSSYWRNVIMFAVGRFFDEPHLRNQRDKIRLLCEDLNEGLQGKSNGLIGSRLAVDVLSSGVMGDGPKYSRALGKIAINLLEFAPTNDDLDSNSLAAIYKPEMDADFSHAASLWLGQVDIDRSIASWWLLNQLIDDGVDWARDYWDKYWPRDTDKQNAIVQTFFQNVIGSRRVGNNLSKVLVALIPQLEPIKSIPFVSKLEISPENQFPDWFLALKSLLDHDQEERLKIYKDDTWVGIEVFIQKLDEKSGQRFTRLNEILNTSQVHSSWKTLHSIIKFIENPTRDILCGTITSIREDETNLQFWRTVAPWPVTQLSHDSEFKKALMQVPSDSAPWLSAQADIDKNGIELGSFFLEAADASCVSVEGVLSWSVRSLKTKDGVFLDAALNALSGKPNVDRKTALSGLFAFVTSLSNNLQRFDPEIVYERVVQARPHWGATNFSLKISPQEKISPGWERFFIRFGGQSLIPMVNLAARSVDLTKWCLEQFYKDQTQFALLKIAGFSGSSISREMAIDTLKIDFDLIRILNSTEDLQVKFAALGIELMIASGNETRIRHVADVVSKLLQDEDLEWAVTLLFEIIDRNQLQNCGYLEVISAVVDSRYGEKWHVKSRAEALRARLLEDESSGFSNERLIELGLPVGHLRS